jgi:predicted nucleotidyltransferase
MNAVNLVRIKKIDDELIDYIARLITEVIAPEKIIVFGSYAYGTPGKESDIDILVVVKESSLPRYKRSIPLYKELSGILIPKDLLVYTEDEIDEWSEVPQSFITTICKKGRVIYEKDTN